VGVRYEPALDGLRALAILLVVAFHANTPGFDNGRIGVDVFFVLSGYLITSILLQRPTLGSFYKRRLWRLAPALAGLLAFNVTIWPFLYPTDNTPLLDALWAGLYLSDIAIPFAGMKGGLAHTWSLAIEMQFYLLWPFLLRLPARLLPLTLLALYAVLTAARFVLLGSFEWTPVYMSPIHVTGLILGGFLALYRPQITARPWMGYLGLVLLTLAFWRMNWPIATRSFSLLAAEVATALLIMGCGAPSLLTRVFSSKPLVTLGILSYGLYLWHYPAVRILRLDYDWTVTLPLTLVLGTAAAWISYNTIEAIGRTRKRTAPVDAALQEAARPS
jgi:peptidoglycan/LPS O-acetylase OafA/YrhL